MTHTATFKGHEDKSDDYRAGYEQAIRDAAKVCQGKWLWWDVMSDPERVRLPMPRAKAAENMNASWDCWNQVLQLAGLRAPGQGENMELLVSEKYK